MIARLLLRLGCVSLVLSASFLLATGENRGEPVEIYATAETDPVESSDDAADDPAIWINAADSSASLVLGTDKRRGLAVYDLDGNQVEFIERGRLNNVGIRPYIDNQGEYVALAAATNRTHRSIDIFQISTDGIIHFLQDVPVSIEEPYGICMGKDQQGRVHAFVNGKDGTYQQWQITNRDNVIDPKLLTEWQLNTQPEGCTVDDESWTLYAGEEELGIWYMSADIGQEPEMTLMDDVSTGHFTPDVEGMDVYRSSPARAYLVVSSQGDDSFAIYDISSDKHFIGSVRIVDHPNDLIDGVEETDGLALSSIPMGDNYPSGLLVVQDGKNKLPKANQNFKLVSWSEIEKALNLKP